MKLGFFIMPVHPTGRDYAQVLKEDRELALIADKLGFAEGFIGEHVTDAAERITSSLIFVASLIGETRNIKLGTGTINMANYPANTGRSRPSARPSATRAAFPNPIRSRIRRSSSPWWRRIRRA